jgi:hypothetical protein
MSVPKQKPSLHTGRWETIRYALDSTSRTIRLCLILIVMIGIPALAVAGAGLLEDLAHNALMTYLSALVT